LFGPTASAVGCSTREESTNTRCGVALPFALGPKRLIWPFVAMKRRFCESKMDHRRAAEGVEVRRQRADAAYSDCVG
jgi:hypothetical protein